MSMNNDGRITGTYYVEEDCCSPLAPDQVGHAFVRDTDGAITTFQFPNGLGIRPASINAKGDVTGTWTDNVYDYNIDRLGQEHAFFWHGKNFSACPSDISLTVAITPGELVPNYANGTMTQTLTVSNLGEQLPAGTAIVIDSLSPNATLRNAIGSTVCGSSKLSPYVLLGKTLPVRTSTSVTLVFNDPSMWLVEYGTHVLATNGRK